jgi:membrane-bound lytic murein transglycosylase F
MNSTKIMPIGLFAKRKIVDSMAIEDGTPQLVHSGPRGSGYFRLFVFVVALLPATVPVEKSGKPATQLEKVKQAREIKVLTRYSPETYYEGPNGYAGLEHDLVQLFAKRLGVNVRFVLPRSGREFSRLVDDKQVDFAAAGIMVTDRRKRHFRFTPPYRRITEQVVYRGDRQKPRYINDLADGILAVAAGVSHAETLQSLRLQNPRLSWSLNYEHDAEGMMFLVNEGLLDYTVVQSDQMLRMRHYFPRLDVAFDVGRPHNLAWAFTQSEDTSLYDEAVRFLEDIKANKQLDQLIDRYYGHSASFDSALDASLRLHYRQRLPQFRTLFQAAGTEQELDWRLLAAVAYQESQWDGQAVSAEGVRGMMMLTGDTARELKVTDRFNPGQSIRGGASYLKETLVNLPQEIKEPDRTWFALAAYNVGYGHVEDARRMVREQGGDPDKWIDVKAVLPLLGKRNWYRRTRHGKARGTLAVHYVNAIRRYYDLLVWLTEAEESRHLALRTERARALGAEG